MRRALCLTPAIMWMALAAAGLAQAPQSTGTIQGDLADSSGGAAASAGTNSQRSLAGVRSAAADSGFSFSGMRGRNNSLSIDGVDNRDETTGANRVSIGLEMVEEFRVSGTSISADSGGAAGGNVNVVTRSGTNIWHGDATYFTQNEFTNARDADVESP